MKLSGRDAAKWFERPNPDAPATLIYGQDAMRVALKRKVLIDALIGPNGAADMRLTRLRGADVRKTPAAIVDGLKAVSFFPGQQVVWVEEATDTAADAILAALQDWAAGDAHLVVTCGALTPRSKLRKQFEAHPTARIAAVYNDPPTREDIAATCTRAGIGALEREAQAMVVALAGALDPGDFGQFIEKLALYTLGQEGPVTVEQVEQVAPMSVEAALDDLIHTVAEAKMDRLSPLLHRMAAQGQTPTGLCIAMLRHFKVLHEVTCHPGGTDRGIAALRPPLFGPRRTRMTAQAKAWGRARLEQALGILMETDRALRSAQQTAPQLSVVERSFIRIAMLGAR